MSPRSALRAAGVAALCLIFAACGGFRGRPDGHDYYTVRSGDTLYSIAFRHGLDYRDLARWNHIANPARIYPGQRLQLYAGGATRTARSAQSPAQSKTASSTRTTPVQPPPSGTPAEATAANAASAPPPARTAGPPIEWSWPAAGAVVARFGETAATGKGIEIGGRIGDDVRAAAPGRVVYTGSGLIGYGKLIIIKHDDTYLSAYGHNDTLLVEQGADVAAGQRVATMGQGPGNRPLLHFEIRIDGKPVDPLQYLPAR
jgi:lipoprotein NlpD